MFFLSQERETNDCVKVPNLGGHCTILHRDFTCEWQTLYKKQPITVYKDHFLSYISLTLTYV